MLFQKRHLSMAFNLFGSAEYLHIRRAYKNLFIGSTSVYKIWLGIKFVFVIHYHANWCSFNLTWWTNEASSSIEGASFDDIDATRLMCTTHNTLYRWCNHKWLLEVKVRRLIRKYCTAVILKWNFGLLGSCLREN